MVDAQQPSLKIVLIEAKLERDTAMFSKQDPFVLFKIEKDKEYLKSRVCKAGDMNPKWNQEFEIKNVNPAYVIEVKVMADEGILNDNDIGRSQIKMSQLMLGKGITEWFILLWNNKKAGEVLLQSIYSGPSTVQETVVQSGGLTITLGSTIMGKPATEVQQQV